MRLLAAFGLIAVVACGGSDSPTAVAPSVVGTWDLQTIDGHALPAVHHVFGTTTYEVMDETAIFAAGGGLDVTTHMRQTPPGSVSTFSSAMAWTQSGSQVTFSGDDLPASISGSELTRHEYTGHVYVYRRR